MTTDNKDTAIINATRYETVYKEEVEPYIEYLNKYAVTEGRTAIRVTDDPANPSNFISKREISLAKHEEGEEYL